ncbi:MAG TPA: DNA polymerase IV [Geminicoccaceae bacterium]|nr:DNA polymerase IV [Geminicoccaceae bacterium]
MRKIIHVDMDAFYAAIEQRDDPGLRGRPIAVGGGSGRGVVMTASYEARPFGVRSAMPGARARRLCPDLVFVPPRFEVYKAVSRELRLIMRRWTELVEPLSLDEAYLDVTEPLGGARPAVEIARALKREILERTGLTASAGVSFNKFLAKTASDLLKPDGLSVIRPEQAAAFIAALPIERFHGVGPATAARMRALGIHDGGDLQAWSEAALVAAFGRAGSHYWRIAQAQDERPVVPDRPRKSLSVEETFAQDLRGRDAMLAALAELAPALALRLARAGFRGRTLTLKIRLKSFRLSTRSCTEPRPLLDAVRIRELAALLLERPALPAEPVRLLGLGVSGEFREGAPGQLDLELPPQG